MNVVGASACSEVSDSELEERLLFRRQFVIGPRFVNAFPSWDRLTISDTLCVTAHPDLSTCQVRDGNRSLTLLGYMLDPERPEAGDAAILKTLLGRFRDGEGWRSLLDGLTRLGGRWALVVDTGSELFVLNDALGLRQVFYTQEPVGGERWCGSQPSLLGEILTLAPEDGFIPAARDPDYWWPAPRTLYPELRQLVPNHYLDLGTGRVVRYWPDRPLERVRTRDAVRICTGLLRGLLESARRRWPLAVTVTAGRDSRVVLAGTRPFAPDVFYFSMQFWGRTPEHADVSVPSRLLSRLGLKHHVIECPASMKAEFESLYRRNVKGARSARGAIAQGLYHTYPGQHLCVKGNGFDLAKSWYRRRWPVNTAVTPRTLVGLTRTEPAALAVESLDEWLSGAEPLYDVNVLDLLWWEQRLGAWQAMGQHEWDIVHEALCPANCRDVLRTILAVPERDRIGPDFLLHERLMRALWPAVLDEPINPHEEPRRSWGLRVKRRIRRTSLYRRLRPLYATLRSF